MLKIKVQNVIKYLVFLYIIENGKRLGQRPIRRAESRSGVDEGHLLDGT
jgi:hypothetical protein